MIIISRIQFYDDNDDDDDNNNNNNNNNNFMPVTSILCLALTLGSIIKTIPATRKYELRPAVSKELYQLRPEVSASCIYVVSRVVNRTRVSCIERYGYTHCPTIRRFLYSIIVRHFIHDYMHTYRTVEWYRQCTVVISCYYLMFKPRRKNIFSGKMIGTLCS